MPLDLSPLLLVARQHCSPAPAGSSLETGKLSVLLTPCCLMLHALSSFTVPSFLHSGTCSFHLQGRQIVPAGVVDACCWHQKPPAVDPWIASRMDGQLNGF